MEARLQSLCESDLLQKQSKLSSLALMHAIFQDWNVCKVCTKDVCLANISKNASIVFHLLRLKLHVEDLPCLQHSGLVCRFSTIPLQARVITQTGKFVLPMQYLASAGTYKVFNLSRPVGNKEMIYCFYLLFSTTNFYAVLPRPPQLACARYKLPSLGDNYCIPYYHIGCFKR